jgi:hypothetical protein
MKTAALAGVLCASATALANPVLQMDLNGFNAQATTGGNPSSFGGVTHTGAVVLTQGTGVLHAIAVSAGPSQPFIDQGFSGTLTGLTGQIDMVNGQVMGGSLTVSINGGADTYTTSIAAAGYVTPYIGGGYKIEGLLIGGTFSDSQFGNVGVAPWTLGSLSGSFLQFNFTPDANGAASADMDLFVQVVPLPPSALSGLATMAGLAFAVRLKRRA